MRIENKLGSAFESTARSPSHHSIIRLFDYSIISRSIISRPIVRNFSRGFTIVELLMVIGILAVLMGLVTTAASESMKASRKRRAEALFSLVQSSLAAYYAQHDYWPDFDPKGKTGNHRIDNNKIDENQYDLNETEVVNCIKEVIMSVKSGNPLIDVSGLWVANKSIVGLDCAGTKNNTGMDFLTAIRGSRKNAKKMVLSDMVFGYPAEESGRFVRFGIGYSISSDQMTVGKRSSYLGDKK